MSEQENTNNIAELATYIPTEWKSGDKVTSAKLNKIEAGVASMQTIIIPTSSYEVWIDDTHTTRINTIQYPAAQLIEAFTRGVNIIIHAQTTGVDFFLRFTSAAQVDESIMFTCANPQIGASSDSIIYWFAPSGTDILMEYNSDNMPYIDQIYPALGGDEGAAT